MPLNDDVIHFENSRYTLAAQWLIPPNAPMHRQLPNNSDAAFGKTSGAKKPSALLLHYNYGAAAVKFWGRKTKKCCPKKPIPSPSGPSKKVHDTRSKMLKMRKTASAAATKLKKTATSKGKQKRKAAWDEDDVMFFVWGNSRAVSERHLKMHEEKRENFEKWRQGVAYSYLRYLRPRRFCLNFHFLCNI